MELSDQDFGVHDGLRTEAEQREYVRTGASQTMDSQHRKQADGWGHAGDLVPFINGMLPKSASWKAAPVSPKRKSKRLKMRYVKPLLLSATALLTISSAACSTVPIATGCSELARPILTQETPHAEIGDSGDAALDWQLYGTAETGQLTKANDDKATGFAVINACEVRDASVTASLNRPWWRPLVPG